MHVKRRRAVRSRRRRYGRLRLASAGDDDEGPLQSTWYSPADCCLSNPCVSQSQPVSPRPSSSPDCPARPSPLPVTPLPDFYYYHSNHLGSSSIMTDRDGNVVRHYEYSPFGNETYAADNAGYSAYDSPSNRYTGQVFDSETGLYYYNARFYDAELARFIQADTVLPHPDLTGPQ